MRLFIQISLIIKQRPQSVKFYIAIFIVVTAVLMIHLFWEDSVSSDEL